MSKLKKLAGTFFVLALGTSTLFAQGYRNGNRAFVQQNEKPSCINFISGLSEKQVEAITGLEEKHRGEMAGLREQRRATTDFDKKDSIGEMMLENILDHRNAIKKNLNEEQQKEFDLLMIRKNGMHFPGSFNKGNSRNFAGRQAWQRGNAGQGNCFGCGARFRQGNFRQNGNCPAFNRCGNGRNGYRRGFGYGRSSSNS